MVNSNRMLKSRGGTLGYRPPSSSSSSSVDENNVFRSPKSHSLSSLQPSERPFHFRPIHINRRKMSHSTKQKKKHIKAVQPKLRVFRAKEPLLSVFMWGINHSVSTYPTPQIHNCFHFGFVCLLGAELEFMS